MSMLITPVGSTADITAGLVAGELTTATSNITITAVGYSGVAEAFGTFDTLSFGSVPGQNLTLSNGVFLSTGTVTNIPTTNTDTGYGDDNNGPGSDLMTAIAQAAFAGAGTSENAAILDVQFTPGPGVDTAQIDLVFASDEFPEFSNSSFVDIGAVLINGNNVGFFNGNPTQPLSIINENLSAGAFIANNITGMGSSGGSTPPTGTNAAQFDALIAQLSAETAAFQASPSLATLGAVSATVDSLESQLSSFGFSAPAQAELTVDNIQLAIEGTELALSTAQFDQTSLDLSAQVLAQTVNTSITTLQANFAGTNAGNLFADVNFDGINTALDTEFDGVSPVLTIPFDVIPGQVNTLTIAISDTGDSILDSVIAVSDFKQSNLSGANQVFVDVTGSDAADNFQGGNANELFDLGLGADSVNAAGGNDLAIFGAGNDIGFGGAGNDIFYGNIGDDVLYGNIGNDIVFGGQGFDAMFGGQNDDVLYGNLADDQMFGNFAADTLFGGQGNDQMFGGQDNDFIFGNKDNDTIAGNLGDDVLIGGGGADVFVMALGGGVDVIADFNASEDRVDLVNIDLGALLSTLTVDQFGNSIVTFAGGGIIFAGVPASDITPDIFI